MLKCKYTDFRGLIVPDNRIEELYKICGFEEQVFMNLIGLKAMQAHGVAYHILSDIASIYQWRGLYKK